jgi:large subunit ribosomal protein L6
MRIEDNCLSIEIPEGIEVRQEEGAFVVKGPKGELKKVLEAGKVQLLIQPGKVLLKANRITKREKKMLGSMQSHILNMVKGVTEGYIYKLKVCSGHFPMNAAVKGQDFVVSNSIGEKHPRVLRIKPGVKVEVAGDVVEVTGNDKAVVSQAAASIECLLKRPDFDRRIFQDGVYITEKDGKEIR